MLRKRLNNKGMSLVEIMVVLAMVTIVMSIAVPSYRTMTARARQKQGFNMLNAFYASSSGIRAEYGFFPGNLVGSAFAPEGELIYRLLSVDNPARTGAPLAAFQNDDLCVNTSATTPCNCAGACNGFRTWREMPVVSAAGAIGPTNFINTCPSGAGGNATTNDNAYIVAIGGFISTTATSSDRYHMDESKNIYMCLDGLN